MAHLVHQRCFHHSLREAVARCPECRQFYCRECITEHEERVICATCLKNLTAVAAPSRHTLAFLLPVMQCVLGLCLTWVVFYLIGAALLSMPTSFHEGTVWIERIWP